MNITRRGFLKGVAVTGAATLVGTNGKKLLAPQQAKAIQVKNIQYTYKPNICNFCANVCGIQVKVASISGKPDRLMKIDGNMYHPYNKGVICARGQSGISSIYNKDRIKKPLIRIEGSKRGEWKFREASWQEAFNYMMNKLKNIKPYEMALMGGWQGCAFYGSYLLPFVVAAQIPTLYGSPIQHCVGSEHLGLHTVFGNYNTHDEVVCDYDRARYILAVRSNGSLAGISTGRAHRFGAGIKNGAKVVVLDPRVSELAAKADEWIPIRPGTDNAFALAMLHVILREQVDGIPLYDEETLRFFTNAPFLAYKDEKGNLQLLADVDKDGAVEAWYVYDELSNSVQKVFGFYNTNKISKDNKVLKPALFTKNLNVNGKSVKTVFEYLMDYTQNFTPEWASKITDVPASTIRRIAIEFATMKPAIIEPGIYDSRYENTIQLRKTLAIIQAITSGYDKPGTWIPSGAYKMAIKDFFEFTKKNGNKITIPVKGYPDGDIPGILRVLTVGFKYFFNPKTWTHGYPSIQWAYLQTELSKGKETTVFPYLTDTGLLESTKKEVFWNGQPYQLKAVFLYALNLVRGDVETQRWKEFLTNLDLVVGFDIMPSDTMLYADVIFPDIPYILKKDIIFDINTSHDYTFGTREPAMPKDGDEMHALDFMYMLSKAMNMPWLDTMAELYQYWKWDKKELNQKCEESWNKYGTIIPAIRELQLRKIALELKEYKGISKTVQELEEEISEKGIITVMDREELMAKYSVPWHQPVPTPSGRMEIYSNIFATLQNMFGYKPNYDPLIAYIPPKWKGDIAPEDVKLEENEFFITHGKVPIQSHTSAVTVDNPILVSIGKWKEGIYYGIWINDKKAKSLGIKEGDDIWVINAMYPNLKVKGKAHLTKLIRPDTIFIPAAFGATSEKLTYGKGLGVSISDLMPYRPEPVVGGYRANEFTVKIVKA
jgi:anaerobic selenocysteine-containing dehydrogenase